jgi:hypothetical protein
MPEFCFDRVTACAGIQVRLMADTRTSSRKRMPLSADRSLTRTLFLLNTQTANPDLIDDSVQKFNEYLERTK